MAELNRRQVRLMILLAVGAVIPACTENEPEPPLNHDLGTDGRILLPTAYVWHDRSIVQGSAEWHPFREPDLSAEGTPAVPDAPPAEEGAASPAEERVRNMIAEYNEIPLDEEPGAFTEYFVQGQAESIQPGLQRAIELQKTLQKVCERLRQNLPDAGSRIDAACSRLAAAHAVDLNIESLTVASDNEVALTLKAGTRTLPALARFIEEYWYLELGDPQSYGVSQAAFDAASRRYQQWQSALSPADADAGDVLTQMEEAAAAANTEKPPAGRP